MEDVSKPWSYSRFLSWMSCFTVKDGCVCACCTSQQLLSEAMQSHCCHRYNTDAACGKLKMSLSRIFPLPPNSSPHVNMQSGTVQTAPGGGGALVMEENERHKLKCSISVIFWVFKQSLFHFLDSQFE